MKMLKNILVILLICNGLLMAQKGWIMDKAHSSVGFEAEHIVVLSDDYDEEKGYPTVGVTQGFFEEFEIQFVPGENNFENSKFVAQIAAKSIDTDNVIRDMDLKSENFFFVEKFPMITFHSKSFTKVDNSKYKMTGELTMRGETREVELEVLLTTVSNDISNYVSFTATGLVDRFDFGMKWSDIFENGRFRVSQYIKLKMQANFVSFAKS